MIVSEVLTRICKINNIVDKYSRNPESLTSIDINDIIDLIEEYRDGLMNMKVSK